MYVTWDILCIYTKSLEERVAEFGKKFTYDSESDWGEQSGKEIWE